MPISPPDAIPSLTGRSIFSNKKVGVALAAAAAVLLGFLFQGPILAFLQDRLTRLEIVTVQKVVTEEKAVIDVVDRASPAVVSIVEKAIVLDPFSGPIAQKQGIGTGFIIKENGLILTNRHVVSDPDAQYIVVAKDGKEYAVVSVHRDTFYDLAILKVDATGLPTLSLGDSDQLKVGQTVVAIGNALGQFSNSVTKGVVSGIGRRVGDLEDVIQTDASINPGNSGGPLLDLSAQVIGINQAIIPGSENIGFSIPINFAKPVIEQFERTGKIIRPFLGVNYYLYTPDEAKLHNLPPGAFVIKVVKDSGADQAGVKAADVITQIDGQQLVAQRSLAKIIVSHQVGDVVTLTIDRDGAILTLTAVLGESPSSP